MRIPILSYHSMHIDGNEYATNDVRALAADLEHLTEAGFRILPLHTVLSAWLEGRPGDLAGRVAALTCDDGSDFDFSDLPHPTWGPQRSVLNTLRDFAGRHPGRQGALHMTSFVIASAEARAALDKSCMIGAGWWNDAWWNEAIASGLMHIGNHSWDHNHEALPESFSHAVARGTFTTIATQELADHEIRRAAAYLRERAPNPGIELFAYPYGESNSYLVEEYFPRHGEALGIKAAVTDRAGYLEEGSNRWEIPRFMCSRDWRSPSELLAILDWAHGAA